MRHIAIAANRLQMLAEARVVHQQLEQGEYRQQVDQRPGNAEQRLVAKSHHQRIADCNAPLAGEQIGQAGKGDGG